VSPSAAERMVELYDTTLRDGAQRAGISYSTVDKLRIAHALDELGVDLIEAGWPGSNPKDAVFFERARGERWRHAALCAFGSTRRAEIAPGDDANLVALLDAGTSVCTIFGKSSRFQAVEILRASAAENLAMISDSVRFLRAAGRRVIYDAEHFFDGFAADPGYALASLLAAADAGAETLVLCDTNGGSLPWDVETAVRGVRDHLGDRMIRIGVHAHNDSGCATANSLSAVRAGARHVQGTINGYGERCGNADLTSIVPGLRFKLGMSALPDGELAQLPAVARLVAEVANLAPDEHAPYVGAHAFAHKGGVHVAAMMRHPESYQHIDPALVGNTARFVVSELSGRANLIEKAAALGLGELDAAAASAAVRTVKDREAEGFSYEAADGSVALLLLRARPGYAPAFAIDGYRVVAGNRGAVTTSEATVKLRIGDRVVHAAADGDGPVHALDAALRSALSPAFPALGQLSLVDYKVRIIDGGDGTRAVTRVLIEWRLGERRFATVGASPNILEATWQALLDGLELALTSSQQQRKTYERADRTLSW
jgi:2-isopropylmalate synthase